MFSASHTLEYSFGAYAVAQMAKALGKTADYDKLMDLSKGWERIYNTETNLIQPKWENGQFIVILTLCRYGEVSRKEMHISIHSTFHMMPKI